MRLGRILALVVGFVFLPAAVLLAVGILVLVFGEQPRDYVFGSLILAFVGTTIVGGAATLVVVRREAQVARLQADFVNKVSHDLRTPLTSIRLFVETLQLGRLPDPERQREALGIIADETARLSALIARLLDWARMESGRRAWRMDLLEPAAVVDDALAAFETQLLHQPAEVARDVAPDLPAIRGDREALAGALLDLLQNALKYTGPDKKIRIAVTQLPAGVAFTVSDNGPGIPVPEQGRIFEKFYRARDPLQRSIEGSGLGLAMVKHIVTAHGGKVAVASAVGEGAAFTLTLPVEGPR